MNADSSLFQFSNPLPTCAVCGTVITGHHDCVTPLSRTTAAPLGRLWLTPWGTWEWRLG